MSFSSEGSSAARQREKAVTASSRAAMCKCSLMMMGVEWGRMSAEVLGGIYMCGTWWRCARGWESSYSRIS